MTEPKEIFVAYESQHVDEARSQAAQGALVVCLNFLVERELRKNNIPFRSRLDFVDSETGEEEWWLLAMEVAREWYRLPVMKFFEHNDIRVGEIIEPIVELYLSRLFYYVRIFFALKKAYPSACFHIPVLLVKDALTFGCLVSFELRAVVDAARMVRLRGVIFDELIASHTHAFLRTEWKSLLVRAYSILISFAPCRSLKIYASEYWSHIKPIIEQMDECELVLMEFSELTHIPWRQILKHRIRIRHPHTAICSVDRRTAIRISSGFIERWRSAKEGVATYLTSLRAELDWTSVLESFEYLMMYASQPIADIDALRRIMEEEKPDIVLQLASVGVRHQYFFTLARVASQLKIPSLELQHASATIDPRSVYSRIETDYLAAYGNDTSEWRERIGHNTHSQIFPTGSPRFDMYLTERSDAHEKGEQLFRRLGFDMSRPVLFVAVPFSGTYMFALDSYQLAEFFKVIHEVQKKIPGMQVLFKFRNDNHIGAARECIKKLFTSNYAIVGSEDIFPLLCASNAVVCGNSTIIYQAMLAKKPLLLYPWKVFDTYQAKVYSPAAPLAYSAEEAVTILWRIFTEESYRKELLTRQEEFLKGYAFDGKSSERVAALLRTILAAK